MFGRLLIALITCLGACAALSAPDQPRILLIPLDDRPVSTQLPLLVGEIGGAEVVLPPSELLGWFSTPGDPDRILEWARTECQERPPQAIVVSLDMLCYGGLIASRTASATYDSASRRLQSLDELKEISAGARIYGFGSLMRAAPTGTRSSAAWSELLAKSVRLEDEASASGDAGKALQAAALRARIPVDRLESYALARRRSLRLSKEAIKSVIRDSFDFLVYGQDDAGEFGPHRQELAELKELAKGIRADDRVSFIQGIDQAAALMMARALVEGSGLKPTIQAVWSNPGSKQTRLTYEAIPAGAAVVQQILAAGAVSSDVSDIQLYINSPGASVDQTSDFLQEMKSSATADGWVGLADINLNGSGGSDESLVVQLLGGKWLGSLRAFSAWNTASNASGSAVAALCASWVGDQNGGGAAQRFHAEKKLLLIRLISDWHHHVYTRPAAYKQIEEMQRAVKTELLPDERQAVELLVRTELTLRAHKAFANAFGELSLPDGFEGVRYSRLSNLTIRLPWPRAYELSVDFDLVEGETSREAPSLGKLPL
jgi:hypothetical protein